MSKKSIVKNLKIYLKMRVGNIPTVEILTWSSFLREVVEKVRGMPVIVTKSQERVINCQENHLKKADKNTI